MSMTIRDPLIIGNKQDNSSVSRIATSSVASTGSTQSDAAVVGGGFVVVTGADGTKGVKLPAGSKDDVYEIKNAAASALKVYPPTGAAINGLSANANISLAANTVARFIFTSPTQIYTSPLLPS